MSSLMTQAPGVFSQQQKQPRHGLIFFSIRKTFSVSAPAAAAPA